MPTVITVLFAICSKRARRIRLGHLQSVLGNLKTHAKSQVAPAQRWMSQQPLIHTPAPVANSQTAAPRAASKPPAANNHGMQRAVAPPVAPKTVAKPQVAALKPATRPQTVSKPVAQPRVTPSVASRAVAKPQAPAPKPAARPQAVAKPQTPAPRPAAKPQPAPAPKPATQPKAGSSKDRHH
jgi:hypothetical protein